MAIKNLGRNLTPNEIYIKTLFEINKTGISPSVYK